MAPESEVQNQEEESSENETTSQKTYSRGNGQKIGALIFIVLLLLAIIAASLFFYSRYKDNQWGLETILFILVASIALLGVYPLTYLAFLGFSGETQRDRLIDDFRLLGLVDENKLKETVENLYKTVFNPTQYMIFILLIILFGIVVLVAFYNRESVGSENQAAIELALYAYLGAYVFSIQELIRRFNTRDLLPQVYSSILVRMITAVAITFVAATLIGLAVEDAFKDPTAQNMSVPAWSALFAFIIGVFPQRGMTWISNRTNNILQTNIYEEDKRPLDRIIGISPLHASRLAVMGIDDCQNLATVDIRRLLLTTQFDTQQIVSWIDQAILYVKVGRLLDRFRDAKIGSFHELYIWVNELDLLSEMTPKQNESLLQQKVPILGLGSADQLRRLADTSSYPNYAHIAEYYNRTGKVTRQRAKLAMDIILGIHDIMVVETFEIQGGKGISLIEEKKLKNMLRELKLILGRDSENTSLLLRLGTLHYNLGQTELAKVRFEEALRYDDNIAEAYANLGAIYTSEGKLDEAIVNFTKALEIDPYLAKAYNLRGIANMRNDYPDRALADLDKAIKLDNQLAEAYLNRGLIYNTENEPQKAIKDFELASFLGHNPDSLWIGWGIALISQEKFQEAIDKLTQAVQGDSRTALAYAKRGYAYLMLNERYYNQARSDLDMAIEIDSELSSAYNSRALLERAVGNDEAAISDYTKALEIDDSQFIIRHNLAKAYQDIGDLESARQEYNQVLEQAAFSQDSTLHDAYRDLGLLEYEQKQYEETVENFVQALAIISEDYEIRYRLGLAYYRLKELDKAREQFQKIVYNYSPDEADPMLINSYENLGLITLSQQDYASALSFCKRGLLIEPNNVSMRYTMAGTYMELGEIENAQIELHKILNGGYANTELLTQVRKLLSQLEEWQKSSNGGVNTEKAKES